MQRRRPQAKLIRVIAGEIFDVAVDLRRGSSTFGRSVGVVLSADNFRQCYIPVGFAHGFCVLTEQAEVEYKCSDVYDATDEFGIAWNDPALAIPWPDQRSDCCQTGTGPTRPWPSLATRFRGIASTFPRQICKCGDKVVRA